MFDPNFVQNNFFTNREGVLATYRERIGPWQY